MRCCCASKTLCLNKKNIVNHGLFFVSKGDCDQISIALYLIFLSELEGAFDNANCGILVGLV